MRDMTGTGRYAPQPRHAPLAFYSSIRLGDPEMVRPITSRVKRLIYVLYIIALPLLTHPFAPPGVIPVIKMKPAAALSN